MSKLFLVIYSAGHIGGSAGPLPYDMAECERRRDEFRAMQAEVLADGIDRSTGKAADPSELAKLRSMSFECEFRDVRPVLGSRIGSTY